MNSHLQCVFGHSLEQDTSTGLVMGATHRSGGHCESQQQKVMDWVICLTPVSSKRTGMVHLVDSPDGTKESTIS